MSSALTIRKFSLYILLVIFGLFINAIFHKSVFHKQILEKSQCRLKIETADISPTTPTMRTGREWSADKISLSQLKNKKDRENVASDFSSSGDSIMSVAANTSQNDVSNIHEHSANFQKNFFSESSQSDKNADSDFAAAQKSSSFSHELEVRADHVPNLASDVSGAAESGAGVAGDRNLQTEKSIEADVALGDFTVKKTLGLQGPDFIRKVLNTGPRVAEPSNEPVMQEADQASDLSSDLETVAGMESKDIVTDPALSVQKTVSDDGKSYVSSSSPSVSEPPMNLLPAMNSDSSMSTGTGVTGAVPSEETHPMRKQEPGSGPGSSHLPPGIGPIRKEWRLLDSLPPVEEKEWTHNKDVQAIFASQVSVKEFRDFPPVEETELEEIFDSREGIWLPTIGEPDIVEPAGYFGIASPVELPERGSTDIEEVRQEEFRDFPPVTD